MSTYWLAGCSSPPATLDIPAPPRIEMLQSNDQSELPEHALDWAGTYQAVLPCSTCAGIAISVQLRKDKTTVVRERRMGNDSPKEVTNTYSGPFYFELFGERLITLRTTQRDAPVYQFLAADGWLEMRNRKSGAPLSADATYRLRKTSVPSK